MLALKFIVQQNLAAHCQSVSIGLLSIIVGNHIGRRLSDPTRRSVMPPHFNLRFLIRTVVIELNSLRIGANIRIRIIYQSSRMSLLRTIWLNTIIIIHLFAHLILCWLFVDSLDRLTLVYLNFILQLALGGDVIVLSKLSLWILVILPIKLCHRS